MASQNSYYLLWIFVAVVVLIMIGLLIWWFFAGSSNYTNVTTTQGVEDASLSEILSIGLSQMNSFAPDLERTEFILKNQQGTEFGKVGYMKPSCTGYLRYIAAVPPKISIQQSPSYVAIPTFDNLRSAFALITPFELPYAIQVTQANGDLGQTYRVVY